MSPRASSSLVAALRERAASHPDRELYTFLADGEVPEGTLTYGEVDRRARAVGAYLAARGLRGQRALLLYPPGLDFIVGFLGCLYAGVVAVPAYPPRSRRSLPRLQSIGQDARPAAALTDAATLAQVERMTGELPAPGPDRWLATDTIDLALADDWRDPELGRDDLAFLQYTSGSTAAPKGVMVSHGNLLENEAVIERSFGVTESSIIVGWLPLYHDMGLIGNVLQPLYAGARCVLFSPVAFLQRPARWLEAISRYRGTTSGGPNFSYDLCVEKIREEERAGLDLSSWTVAFNGAEPVRAETLDRFARSFAAQGFRREAFFPCYGLAEATLFVSGGKPGDGARVERFDVAELGGGRAVASADGRALTGAGRVAEDAFRLAIVDPETLAPVPAGTIGEILLSGPSVARGYFGKAEATAETFGARPAGEPADGPDYLRTGDLGFLDPAGELFIAGRQKDLIIIRGRNFYPQDLELTAELAHPALRRGCSAAFAYEHEGAERLVVAIEIDRRREDEAPAAAEEVRRAVAQEHEVQPWDVLVVRAGSIPKTSSGKIQRRRCRQAWRQGELELIEESSRPTLVGEEAVATAPVEVPRPADLVQLPAAEKEAQVLAFLRARAARAAGVAAEHIDPREPVTAAGLDSLGAVELKHGVEVALGVELGLAAILDGASLEDLTREVVAGLEKAPAAAPPAVRDLPPGLVPLSAGQQALFFLHRLAPSSPAYNVAGGARLRGPLDAEALRRTFQALADRHELLRARVGSHGGQPVFVVPERGDVVWEVVDAQSWTEDSLADRMAESAARPFDLERGPVFRVTLYRRSPEDHFLELAFHHLVSDLWSLAVIAREIDALYPVARSGALAPAASLPPVTGRFEDFVHGQRAMLAGPEGQKLFEYWRDRLAGAPQHLDLPTDRPRPPVRRLLGSSRSRWLPAGLGDDLTAASRARGGTLFMAVLAGLEALLSRYTGQTDILVGSPTTGRAGRGSAAYSEVVGYFVNPVVVRGDLAGDPTVDDMLTRTREAVLGAFEHQDYPFALLAEKLGTERDTSRGGLVDVLLVFQKSPFGDASGVAQFSLGRSGTEMRLGDLAWQSVDLPIQGSQFDLSLYLAADRGGLGVTAQYDTDLFEPETIDRLLGHLETVLGAFASAPETTLSALPLLTSAERRQVLVEWAPGEGRAIAEEALELSMHGHFEAQVARTPNREALVAGHDRMTYAELDRASQHLAARLRALGVGPEVTVGVFAHRTADLVVALLGVLKAGGAYVPLDPAYPEDRVAIMAEDSRMAVLLTQASLAAKVPAGVPHVLEIDGVAARRHEEPARFDSGVGPDNLAYLIYTSGSTGRPKGVAICHKSAAALFAWSRQAFSDDVLGGLLASTSVCFDLSVFELFVPLARGGRVILADNALALPDLPARNEVTLVNTVPSAIAGLVKSGGLPVSARTVCLAGEPLRGQLVEAIYATGTVDRVVNLYGPSEDTTYSTIAECPKGAQREPTIGRPLVGSRAYVVDRTLQPVPRGVPGELLLGGLGLSRGYLGRPALTAERYIPDPFAGEEGTQGEPGDRLYRTGDLVRYLPDGELEFLGRLDHQVKVRGFRIELGEIETTLTRHPEIGEAVLAVFGEGADKALVAYVAPKPGRPLPALGDLRSYLGARLPAYMVPTAWVELAALPRTPNGKIDRRALPPPSHDRPDLVREYVAPETPVEEMLAEIWTEVLGVPKIGIHDSFFELGGHSLKATQLLLRVRETFGVDLPVQRLFETPTIHHLALVVEETLLEGVEEG